MLGRDSGGEPVLSHDNIRNQIMTFLIAGQLTTSELMPNALYNLMHHPAVLSRVQTEVDAVFGVNDDYLPTYDDIGKLAYLRQVINETLRLSPPVLSFDRMALSDTTIGGKYPIKQGEAVTVLTGALHRQPEWGDNVEFFDPDRFDTATRRRQARRVVQTVRYRGAILHRASVRPARGHHGDRPVSPPVSPDRLATLCAAIR